VVLDELDVDVDVLVELLLGLDAVELDEDDVAILLDVVVVLVVLEDGGVVLDVELDVDVDVLVELLLVLDADVDDVLLVLDDVELDDDVVVVLLDVVVDPPGARIGWTWAKYAANAPSTVALFTASHGSFTLSPHAPESCPTTCPAALRTGEPLLPPSVAPNTSLL
jgi:hypothetical protein